MISASLVQPSNIPETPERWGEYLVLVAVAGAVGWFIEHLRKAREITRLTAEIQKLNTEVKKLQVEEIKLAGDVLKELQRSRDLHTEACSKCTECASAIVNLLNRKGPVEEIKLAREQFCSVLMEKTLPAYCSLVEWQALTRKNQPEQVVSFIKTDVIPELQRIRNWVSIINLPMFITGYSLKPLSIQERTMRAFFDLTRFVPEDREKEIGRILFDAIRGVVEA